MRSTSRSEGELKENANQTLSNPIIINANDERHDKGERDAKRAWYTLQRKLPLWPSENDGDRVWPARTQAATDVWLGCLAGLL